MSSWLWCHIEVVAAWAAQQADPEAHRAEARRHTDDAFTLECSDDADHDQDQSDALNEKQLG